MTLGENIKKIRKERGLTQKQLGELCSIDEANIRKYENGKQDPRHSTLGKIAKALGVPMNKLLPPEERDKNPISNEVPLLLAKEKIKNKHYGYTSDEKKEMIKKIDRYIEEIYKIEDIDKRTQYGHQAFDDIMHEILDHMLSQQTAGDLFFFSELIVYYFSLKYDIRKDIVNLVKYIYGNPEVRIGYVRKSTTKNPDEPDAPQD